MLSLRTKLTAAFATTAILCVIMISLFSNRQLNYHFQEYVQQNQFKRNLDIIALIEDQWNRQAYFTENDLKSIGIYALKQGMIIQVSQKGDVLWDGERYLKENVTEADFPYTQSTGLVYKDYKLIKDQVEVATIKIANNGKVYYNQLDLHFVQTLNQVFIVVGLLSSLLAICFGAYLSKRISMPITKVTRSAAFIAEGTYNERVYENSNTKEIKGLTDAINQLASTLEVQETLRKRLTADVAHELRTPLTTIQSHMEAMVDGVWEPTIERLSSCHEEIVRITGLVSDLEKLAHYENDNLLLNKVHFDGELLVSQVLQAFEATLAQKKIQVDVHYESTGLYGDRDKIKQVLINLISNAIKFSESEGTLTIRLDDETLGSWIEITDAGIGIDEKDLPFIFERFYRADVSRNRQTGGAGIGLSLVKIIVEAHQGKVQVFSHTGQGTTFRIFLPK